MKQLETNLDDMTPETLAYVQERLLAAGASDVWYIPIVMKKSRPAVTLCVLCEEKQSQALVDFILQETTSWGVREFTCERTVLPTQETEIFLYGESVRVKYAHVGNEYKCKPEYEDCARIARVQNMPLRQVQAEAKMKGEDRLAK